MSNMLLQYPSLLHLIFFLLLLLPLAFSSSLIAKPGCPDRCGDISIPFPFGVGSKCSLGPSFEIICNASTNPPKPYVTINASAILEVLEVMEINPSGQIRVNYPYLLTASCPDMSRYVHNYSADPNTWFAIDFTENRQYTLSEENWVTAIGCDDVVLGNVLANDNGFRTGCVSYCANGYGSGVGLCPDNGNGYSGGNGCCRTSIPRGTTLVEAQLNDLGARWTHGRLFPCSYAFIQEKQSSFSYPLSYLNDSTAFVIDSGMRTSAALVMRLDWRIEAENCSHARRSSTTFACRDNSVCVDFDANVGGYLCRCLEGYDGNPYLPGGCRDINECDASRMNPCGSNSICTNTPGLFTCSCRKGYGGDGTKKGTGCNRLPQSKILINILTGLGSGLVFLLLLAICFWLYKVLQERKIKMYKEKFFKRNGGLLLQQQTNEGTLGKTKLFSAEELETATDHFNESRVLGKGGQGIVYKGMLSDGKIVAIKKSKLVDENLLEEFINEVVILSQINHRNVVKLLGCCLETEVPMLVYEFLPNGTLFDLIQDPNTKSLVSWNMRLKIASDIAGALAYIHTASSVPIYHRDIKSKNFLLDEKYIVKVADFGISRTVAVNQTHLTTMVKGTFGYLDPEYFHSHQYSEKSEVYSFGVVLAELVTGKRPIFWESEEGESLAARFLECAEENSLDTILDPQVFEHGRKEEVIAVARLAQRCLNSKRKMRPTMKEVAIELESLRISQTPATVNKHEEARVYNANPMMISDIQDTLTTSCFNETAASSDTHPFMIENV